jgi:DNA repair exonuclease SbcCD ATPase subunit
MALNHINFFRITPTERIQLILGTNGSGKSSLVSELSPLPAMPIHYEKDGYKSISITHLGNEYVLTSKFHPTQKHSIIKNGVEELNTGGTVTVQKDLVKTIFGYRQDIHELLTGIEKFSSMSLALRRKWFTELCETNYDYAISVYNKVSERSRDTSGALKLARRRLVVEAAKVISSEEINKIRQEIEELLREINLLYNSRKEDKCSIPEIIEDQRKLESEIVKSSNRVLFLTKGKAISKLDELTDCIDELKHDITRASTESAIRFKTYNELKEKYDTYSKTDTVGLEELRRKYNELVIQKNEIQSRKQLNLTFDDPNTARTALLSIFDLVERITHEISPNENRNLSFESLQILRDKEYQLKDKIQKAISAVSHLQHQLKHMEDLRNGESTECPNCRHRWIPGYTLDNLNKINDGINSGTKFLDEHNKKLEQTQKSIEENVKYGELIKEYMRCVRTIPILNPFWDIVKDTIYLSPMQVYRDMEKLRMDLEYDSHCIKLNEEQIKNNALIDLAIKANNADIGKMSDALKALETELGNLAQSIREKQRILQDKQQELLRVQEIIKLGETLSSFVEKMESNTTDLLQAIRNDLINKCLNQLQIQLAQKQNALNEVNVQRGIISDIETNIERLESEEKALSMLVECLSPHDGLIAEGLLGFIRSFIRKMNLLISKIWTYRLEVRDCSIDSESGNTELDYKFPMIVGDSDTPVSDISKGSGGMCEIIDLAFKVVAMQYLDLSAAPLFADELGQRMDSEHKTSTVNLIKYLLDYCAFSQLYMISHDYVQFTALSNTECCVLSATNIVVPDKFNEHVVIA